MEKENPLVSVIMPCYNCEKYVYESLMSILNQTYENLEILIADDGSTDGTLEIIRSLAKKDERVKLVEHKENLKIVKTLNELVDLSNGEYIARMDSDDISFEDRIEKQVQYLTKHNECGLCGTSSIHIDGNGKVIGSSITPVTDEDNKLYMRYGNTIYHPTIMARASVLKDNPYDEGFLYAEDYELWCRLIFEKNIKVYNLPEQLLWYRIYNDQSSEKYHDEQMRKAEKIIRKYNVVSEDVLERHLMIFFSTDFQYSLKEKAYILELQKMLKSNQLIYASAVEHKIMYFLWKNRSACMLFRCLCTRLGIYTVFKYILSKSKLLK